jgi:hypothetical protein
LAKLGTVYVEVKGDFSALRRETKLELATMGRDFTVKAEIKADVDQSSFSRAKAAMRDLKNEGNRLSGALSALKFPLLGAGITVAAQALNALGGGLVAVAAGLTPLAGALAAIPQGASAAIQGLGTIKLATEGISEALKAHETAVNQLGTSSVRSGQQQAAAAETVRAAEEALTQNQKQAVFAQQALTLARFDATRQLQDMRRASLEATGQEQAAKLAVQQARLDLQQGEADPTRTFLQLEQLQNALDLARANLRDTQIQGQRSQQDYAKAQRQGISQNPQVVQARRAVADANKAVADSERQVALAQKAAADQITATSTSFNAYKAALAGLEPAQRQFVQFLIPIQERMDDLRNTAAKGLFPGVERGIRAAMGDFGLVRRIIGQTAATLGNFAARAGRYLGSGGVQRDIGRFAKTNLSLFRSLGDATFHWANSFRFVMDAAQPLLRWMGRFNDQLAHQFEAMVKGARQSGDLRAFFHETRIAMERFVEVGKSVATILYNIGRAAFPLGKGLFKDFDDSLKGIADWTSSQQGQQGMRQYFNSLREPIHQLVGLASDLVKGLFEITNQPAFVGQMAKGLRGLVPLLQQLLGQIVVLARTLLPSLLPLTKSLLEVLVSLGPGAQLLTRALTHLANALSWLIDNVPGVKQALDGLVLVWGGVALAGWVKGLSVVKNLGIAFRALAGSTAFLRLQLLGLLIQEKIAAAFAAIRAAFAATTISTVGLTVAVRALVSATVIGALITAAILIATHWSQTKKVISNVWHWINDNTTLLLAIAAPLAPFIVLPILVARNWKTARGILAGVWGSLGGVATQMKDAVLGAFRKMGGGISRIAGGIGSAIATVATVIRTIVGFIVRAVNKAISALGDLKDKIPSISLPSLPDITPGVNVPFVPGQQRGGTMVPGAGSGDKVPLHIAGRLAAMVEPREVVHVTNRKAAERLQVLNQVIPRFARGGQLGPIKVGGTPGALRSITQGAATRVRKAANAYIAKHHPTVGIGLGATHFKGSVPKVFAQVARALGAPRKAVLALFEAGIVESGMKDLAGGSGSSSGPLQLLASTAAGLGVSPHDVNAIAKLFLTRGFFGHGGAISLAKSSPGLTAGNIAQLVQGSAFPSRYDQVKGSALSLMKQYGFQRGGIVQGFQRGGVIGDPRTHVGGHRSSRPLLSRARGAAPLSLAKLVQIADLVDSRHFSYNWGGGHEQPAQLEAFDCSGAVSYLLQQAGFPISTRVAAGFRSAFQPGSGKDFTIYASPSHVFTGLAGKQWGTSDANPGGGAGWFSGHSTAGYTARHPLLAKAAAGAGAVAGSTGAAAGTPKKPALSPKQKRRLHKLLKKVKGLKQLGLDPSGHLQANLDSFTADATRMGDLADRANQLGDAVQGLTEAEWLHDELKALFRLRNTLIRAQMAVTAALAKLARMLEDAKGKTLSADERKKVQARLSAELHKPSNKQNHALITSLRAKLAGGGDNQFSKALATKLKKPQTDLTNKGSELATALETVQGPLGEIAAGFSGILPTLPPLGALGGSIFDTQIRLQQLGADTSGITDNSAAVELLKQLLREANLRTAVSEAQFDVFRNYPSFGGSFGEGGVIPGPAGVPTIIQAHGQEVVLTPEQQAAMGGGDVHAHLHFKPGTEWLRDFIQVEVERGRGGRRISRGADRLLPGTR